MKDAFEATFDAERDRSARWMIVLRVIYVAVMCAWTGWASFLRKPPSGAAEAQLPVLGIYLLVAVLAFGVVQAFPRLLRPSWWLLVGVDVPMVVSGQWIALSESHYGLARVEAVLAQLLFLVVIAQVSMRRRLVFAVALLVTLGDLLLLGRVHGLNPGRWIFTPLFVGAFALIVDYLPRRLRRVLKAAAVAEVQRERLSRYFSPAVAEQIRGGDEVPGAPVRCDVTVLFADLRGFTRASANLEPTQVAQLVERHLTVMVEAVFRYGGTLDKFLGDGLLAYFGAPLPQADHARRAVLAAQDIVRDLGALALRPPADGLPVLECSVGLHSGAVVVGSVGPEQQREFTVLGDVVNVASRMEGLAKKQGCRILVSDETRQRAGDPFAWRELPPVEIRGKATPMHPFTLDLEETPSAASPSQRAS